MTILKVAGYVHCLCSGGLPGEVNDEIAMNITFIHHESSCSASCNSELYQPQLPCIWNNITWNETTGICTGIMDMSTPSDTDLCCCVTDSVNASTINSTVSRCKDLSLFANGKGSNTVAIILGFFAGVIATLVTVCVTVTLVVYIWRAKRRDYDPGMIALFTIITVIT